MTRLENMRQFLLEYGVNPEKEPINTVMFHLGAAARELDDCRNAEFRKSVQIADLLLEIEKLGEQRDMLAETLRRTIDPRCSDREKFIYAGKALATIYKP